MSKNFVVFNNQSIYFDNEPRDWHIDRIAGVDRMTIDTNPYISPKLMKKKSVRKNVGEPLFKPARFRGGLAQKLIDSGLKPDNPVVLDLGDYNKKTIYAAVKKIGFERGSIEDTKRKGVYKISCI